MSETPELPWLDLERTRRMALRIRGEREQAIERYEKAVKDAAEKKREFRKRKGIELAKALQEHGVTAALEIARAEAADAEYESELATGHVGVAKEAIEQSKEDLWSLRHFSERTDALERWGGPSS